MDSLTYHYWDKNNSNQIEYISDGVASSGYGTDLTNQGRYNYHYDKIGNLTTDGYNGISQIKWNVYGKITNIYTNTSDPEGVNGLGYLYDPNGNRVQKDVYYYNSTKQKSTHDWYVRDAQGNVMAVYSVVSPVQGGATPLYLSERYLYGSSRLGVLRSSQDMNFAKVNPVYASLIGPTYLYTQQRGNKFFELSNHLGNVLVTISDRKVGVAAAGNGSLIDHYEADVVNASDYYPFGMLMPGRRYSAGSGYRYGFNGKENDNEVKGDGNQQDYGMRIYDPRVGRFLSVDPLQNKYPELTAYQFASNSPIANIDLDGLEKIYYALTFNDQGQPLLKQTKTENFTEKVRTAQYLDENGRADDQYSNVTNPWKEYYVTYSWQTYAATEAIAIPYTESVTQKYDDDPTTKNINEVVGDVDERIEEKENSRQFWQGFAGGIHGHISMKRMTLRRGVTAEPETPSAKTNKITTAAHHGNEEAPAASSQSSSKSIVKAKNLNNNDAEGNFVLYEIRDKGKILKIGKANADDLMADGTIRRMHTSERLAKKAGYENAKAYIVERLGRTTTREAKKKEAARVRNARSTGQTLPLNNEKDKSYHN